MKEEGKDHHHVIRDDPVVLVSDPQGVVPVEARAAWNVLEEAQVSTGSCCRQCRENHAHYGLGLFVDTWLLDCEVGKRGAKVQQ